MALANCPKCSKLFNKLSQDICPDCVKMEEKLLNETQKFLRGNRNAGRHDILNELEEVTTMLLDKWVETKRINIISEDDLEEQQYKQQSKLEMLEKLKKNKGIHSNLSSPGEETKKKSMGMHFKRGH